MTDCGAAKPGEQLRASGADEAPPSRKALNLPMKNQPTKETHKDNFFDLIHGSAQPSPAQRIASYSKMSASPNLSGYSGKQIHSRTMGGASGRHGGRSR